MNRAFFSRLGVVAGGFGMMLAAMAAASGAVAQRWGGDDRGGGRRAGPGGGGGQTVERVIRLADELELTGSQLDRLEAIRVELLEARAGHTVRRMELESEVRAGMQEPEAMRAQARELAGEARELLGGIRDRYAEILTDEQRDELRRLNRRAGWRDRGVRSGRAGDRFDRMRDSRGRRTGNRWDGAANRWRGAMERTDGAANRWLRAMPGGTVFRRFESPPGL